MGEEETKGEQIKEEKNEETTQQNPEIKKTEEKSGMSRFKSWFSNLFSRKKKTIKENDEIECKKEPSAFSKKKKQTEDDKEKLTENKNEDEDEQAVKDPQNADETENKEEEPVVDPASVEQETDKIKNSKRKLRKKRNKLCYTYRRK